MIKLSSISKLKTGDYILTSDPVRLGDLDDDDYSDEIIIAI